MLFDWWSVPISSLAAGPRCRVALQSSAALGKTICAAYGGSMTRTESTSDAEAELHDVIRSIDAIGEGASGHEDPTEASERKRAAQVAEE